MSSSAKAQTQTSVSDLVDELVLANRILAKHDVLDTYGHISVRHPTHPTIFLMAARKSPALVTRKDIIPLWVKTGEPVLATETRAGGPSEKHIHAALYRVRPEVDAVLHCHAPILVTYSILPPWVPGLQPVVHVGACTGHGPAPIYDIAANWGEGTNMLVCTPQLGDDLANTFVQNPETDLVLMRGHGATIASSTGVKNLVHKGIYSVINANILKDARLLMQSAAVIGQAGSQEIKYLSEGEVKTCKDGAVNVSRSWEVWKMELHPEYGTEQEADDPWVKQ